MQFRDPQLSSALDAALDGNTDALFDKLRRASGLPGVRINMGLVHAFAHEVSRRGKEAEGLVQECLAFDEKRAPYGHVNEIFPILAVSAIGARAAQDARFLDKALSSLEQTSCDERFRVRQATTEALGAICIAIGEPFAKRLMQWLQHEEMFIAASAAAVLHKPKVLSTLGIESIRQCLPILLDRIPLVHRAGRRYTSFRRLCEEVTKLLVASCLMFPVVTSDLEQYVQTENEDLRAILHEVVQQLKTTRISEKAHQLEKQLKEFDPRPRDPRHGRLPGKRGRGR